MKRFASIDVGSNSILLHIADYDGEKFTEVYDDAQIASLGKNIDRTKNFSEESMLLAFNIFQNYSLKLKEHNVSLSNTFMTATEASRAVENSSQFFKKIKDNFDLDVNIISGEEEARFACLGAVSEKKTSGLLLDIGGASTEVIEYEAKPFSLKKVISLPIGSVRATDWMTNGIFERKVQEIFHDFEKNKFKGSEITAIAGTVTSLMAMNLDLKEYDDQKVNGQVFDVEKLNEFVENIKNYSVESLKNKYPFLGKRAEVIVGGAIVLQVFSKKLNLKKLHVSTRGLRHGVLVNEVQK